MKLANRISRLWSKDVVDQVRAQGVPAVVSPNSNVGVIPLGSSGTATSTKQLTTTQIEQIIATCSTIRGAVETVANYVSNIPIKSQFLDTNEFSLFERESGVAKVLAFCNKRESLQQLLRDCIIDLGYYERCYIAVIPNDAKDRLNLSALQMIRLPVGWVYPRVDATGVTRYYISKNGEPGEGAPSIPAENIIYIHGYSLATDYIALSRMNNLAQDIELSLKAKRMVANYYNNATIFGSVITAPNSLDEDEMDKYREQLDEKHRGSDNAYKTIVLGDGMTYEQVKSTNMEVNAIPVLDASIDETLMLMGVPKGLLYHQAGADIAALEYLFWNRTGLPLLNLICGALSKFFCDPVNNDLNSSRSGPRTTLTVKGKKYVPIEYSIKPDLRAVDALNFQKFTTTRVDVAQVNSGTATINEKRAEQNKAPIPAEFEINGQKFTSDLFDQPIQLLNAVASSLVTPVTSPTPTGGTSGTPNGVSATPSLSLPGSQGGRDQSAGGEAQMIDTTGTKEVGTELDQLAKQLRPLALDVLKLLELD
jgi:hypothetical protein